MSASVVIRFALALSVALAVACTVPPGGARAASSPSVVLPDGTIRYDYGRRPTPLLACKPHYVCDIALDSGESVLNMAIGDATHWVVAGGGSGPNGTTPHVFVKPTQAGLDTNLVITTSKRVYEIALRSADDAKHSRMSFFYADDDAAAKAAIADHERAAIASILAGTPQVALDAADTKYKVSGDSALTPDKVFNDGSRTFIEWKALPNELPAVVAVAKDGSVQPANFRLVGSTYIVDSVEPNFDLVVGGGSDRRGRAEHRASIRHL